MSILNEVKRIFGVNGKSIEEALSNADPVSGGSGGGVFITTGSLTTETTVTLDKTWQEIHDAISSGMIGVVRNIEPSEVATAYSDHPIESIAYSEDSESYQIRFNTPDMEFLFATDTADGYPVCELGES